MQSSTVDLEGSVHYVDFGGSGRPIVLVHGLGGSHLNWLPVAERLAKHGRVLALDLAGFGRTPSMGRSADVEANTRLLAAFVRKVADGPVVLVGNSMGGYISLALASAQPDLVKALVLVAPAQPIARLKYNPAVLALLSGTMPFFGEALMRRRAARGPEEMVKDLLALCTVDVNRIDASVIAAHIEMARERATYGEIARRDFSVAARSLAAALLRRDRFFDMVRTIRAPALIIQGEQDQLVQVESSRALAAARPDWQLVVFDDVGHVPQLEAPARFLAAVEPWLVKAARE